MTLRARGGKGVLNGQVLDSEGGCGWAGGVVEEALCAC